MKPMTFAGVVASMAMVGSMVASAAVAPTSLLLDVSIKRGGFETLSNTRVTAAMDQVTHIQLDDRYRVHVIPKAGDGPRQVKLEVVIEDVQARDPIARNIFAAYGTVVPVPLGGVDLQRLELVAWSR